MVRPRKTAAAAPDKRAMLQTLMEELGAEQEKAIQEAHAYFTGPIIGDHLKLLARLQSSSLPNQTLDQLINSNVNVITATANWLTQWVNRPNPEAAEPQPQP